MYFWWTLRVHTSICQCSAGQSRKGEDEHGLRLPRYKTKDGVQKSTCGPCFVSGTGGFGCPPAGGPGPEGDSTVTRADSMLCT